MQEDRYESLRSKRKTNELAYAKSAKIAKITETEMPVTNGRQEIPKKASKKPVKKMARIATILSK